MESQRRNVLLAVVMRAGVVLALLAIAISVYALLVRTRKEPAVADPVAALPRVEVIQASLVPIGRQWQGFGTAAAAPGRAANVPAQVRGVVERIGDTIVAGATVQRGDVLVQLDDADFRHEVDATRERIAEIETQVEQLDVEFRAWIDRLELAQEDVEIARRDLDRILVAQERGSATQREVDQMRAALIAARRSEVQVREQLESIEPRARQLQHVRAQQHAALQLAERNLARTRITSPIDGILQTVDVEVGESVVADSRVARVVDLRRVEVPLRLPAAARASVRVGDEAMVRSAGASGGWRAEWPAVISRIAPEDDEQTRTVTVYVEIEQDPAEGVIMTPGKFVQGFVSSSDVRDRVVLPRRTVHADRVWLVDEHGYLTSRRVNVQFSVRGVFVEEFGIDDEAWLVVDDVIPPGALVVLEGARTLVEGSRVEPVAVGREGERISRGADEIAEDVSQ